MRRWSPVAGTLAYQMDGVFIGATWSADMRNMMLLSLAVYLAAWWALSGLVGIAGLWIALLVFLGARGGTPSLALPQADRPGLRR